MKKDKKKSGSADKPKVFISQSLAVKHRPRKFSDLVGQDKTVAVLRGMFKSRKIPGSILFEGATGSGKTTCVRLFCLYLQCEKGTACGECDSCQYVMAKTHPDVQEYNMGTHGKVEDARGIVKSARAAPVMGSKRIIILEEAHKMTDAAANALLLSLEEPPKNTIFILATTNPEKLIKTILNRCTRITLTTIERSAVIDHLLKIAKKEGVDLEKTKGAKDALGMIADFSAGHMREAISLLEYVLYAIQGGADLNNKTVMEQFLSNSEVDMDKLAASIVCAILDMNLEAVIKFILMCSNTRGLIGKCRWLIDFLIRQATGTIKFTPYSGRIFLQTAKQKNIEYSLPQLLRMQNTLVNTELLLNSTSIDESVLLQTKIGVHMSDEYELQLDAEAREEGKVRKKKKG